MHGASLHPDQIEESYEADQTVHGVNLSIFEETDWESDSAEKYPAIHFTQNDDTGSYRESIDLPSTTTAEEAREIFEFAVANVPEGHPQRLYIAYGIVKQEVSRRERAAYETEKQQAQSAALEFRNGLDKSYHVEGEVNGQKVQVRWREDFGKHGMYVMDFPGLESYMIDSRCRPASGRGSETGPMVALGVRPDFAAKMYNRTIQLLKHGGEGNTPESADKVQRYIYELVEKFEKHNESGYLWDQANRPFNDIEYIEQARVNGINLSVGWDPWSGGFTLIFPDSMNDQEAQRRGIYDHFIGLGKNSHEAKEAFEYAKARAAIPGTDVYAVYEAVQDMVER